MKRGTAGTLGVMLAIGVAGCGGGTNREAGSSGSARTAVTQQAVSQQAVNTDFHPPAGGSFASRADAICKQAGQAKGAQLKTSTGSTPSLEKVRSGLVMVEQHQLRALKSLKPPADAARSFAAYMATVSKQGANLEQRARDIGRLQDARSAPGQRENRVLGQQEVVLSRTSARLAHKLRFSVCN